MGIHELIRDGYSFSGHERHCCFLNTGGGRFANVSAISGLDFPDDGRATARVDWDQDGDLDLWVANRNGPQVRFLRNDVPTDNHFLAVRLVGRECNRDAIGARTQLVLQGGQGPTTIKTLRAGEGFLSQSSQWLHFGLGNAVDLDRLIVHWPGGDVETFRGLQADRRYLVVQGSGQVAPAPSPARGVALVPSPFPAPPPEETAAVFLASRVPLPPLDYMTSHGEPAYVAPIGGKPVLLNLWASWCTPCVTELTRITRRETELRAAGVEVLALSTDHVSDARAVDDLAATRLMARLSFPFPYGQATVGLLDKLQLVHDQLFDRRVTLPLPTSVLIDAHGQLAAMYKGPVEVDRVLADAGKLGLTEDQMRQASVEFPGRWLMGPARISLIPIFRQLVQQGYGQDAVEYVARNYSRFPPDIATADLMARAGDQRLAAGEVAAAEERFRYALTVDPGNAHARVKLGIVLERKKQTDQAEAQYREALKTDPDNVAAHFALGLLLKADGRTGDAIDHFHATARLRPDHVPTCYHLAQLLATDSDPNHRDGTEAVRWAEKAARATRFQKAEVLDVLAAAYAEAGRFDEATTMGRRARQLAEAAQDQKLGAEIDQKLQQYARRRPFHRGDPVEPASR